ncbi:hypothetical protein [Geodermatophilus ruber]|uniref:Amidase n=1 Tax=Geodermatophilus ruber TaxID=504800 RepID=A0A1I3Z8B9_9ACTN|nr:hypothetical protein [Geodermatophilus ruber]SFK39866.1 hypothetical protein SAMN04488085_101393 [Geodermatophilus ruber]
MTPIPRALSAEAMALAARLELGADRQQPVGQALEAMYAILDRLDAVPLGETPPATAFDARWEG